MTFESGLYVVATPIGNLADMSQRAIDLLTAADIVAVEDSRVTGKLLHHLGIKKKMRRYNDHSGDVERESLVAAARGGVVALVSDAGTPLISDPGYKLVRAARDAGVSVFTIPGASAVTAALSICGLPTVSTNLGATGLVYEPGEEIVLADDPDDFAAACIEILTNDHRTKKLAEAARKRALCTYTWDAIWDRIAALYGFADGRSADG